MVSWQLCARRLPVCAARVPVFASQTSAADSIAYRSRSRRPRYRQWVRFQCTPSPAGVWWGVLLRADFAGFADTRASALARAFGHAADELSANGMVALVCARPVSLATMRHEQSFVSLPTSTLRPQLSSRTAQSERHLTDFQPPSSAVPVTMGKFHLAALPPNSSLRD